MPLVLEPILKPKPWGGRRLARLFGKEAGGGGPIGESWEVADLPGNESRVAGGPLAGQPLRGLMDRWGGDLIGRTRAVGARFPLLLKFLDAGQPLSVQVHPSGRSAHAGAQPAGLKHEAWYVVDADPGSVLFIGCKPGVGLEDVARATPTAALVDLLCRRPARRGACYYLPAGVPHALGAGLLVAEVQTPSDVTYRLYDWERPGLDGRPRELHIEQALANLRCDIPEEQIAQPRVQSDDSLSAATKLVGCDRFVLTRRRLPAGLTREFRGGEMAIWMILVGSCVLSRKGYRTEIERGNTVLIPAVAARLRVETTTDCELLEVRIPA